MRKNLNRIFLLSVSCLLLSACNNEGQFYKNESAAVLAANEVGIIQDNVAEDPAPAPIQVPKDPSGLCSQLSNLDSCKSTEGCQPLYKDNSQDSSFIGCIAILPPEEPKPIADAPILVPAEPDAGEKEPKAPVADAPKAPEAPVAEAPIKQAPEAEAPVKQAPEAPVKQAPLAPPVEAPVKAPVKAPVAEIPAPAPEGVPQSCDNIDPKYLSGNKGQKKVTICHNSAKDSHSIVIACAALNAHKSHHDDSVGPCSSDE